MADSLFVPIVKATCKHRNCVSRHAIHQTVLMIDTARIQGRVLVMAQALRLSYPAERIGLDRMQQGSYSLYLLLISNLPVGEVSSTVGGEVNSPL